MPPRPFVLHEANYRQLREYRPAVAVLPWGATEAHNYHLPHGTDVIEACAVAERAAELADGAGGGSWCCRPSRSGATPSSSTRSPPSASAPPPR